jgi:hypothetical protein
LDAVLTFFPAAKASASSREVKDLTVVAWGNCQLIYSVGCSATLGNSELTNGTLETRRLSLAVRVILVHARNEAGLDGVELLDIVHLAFLGGGGHGVGGCDGSSLIHGYESVHREEFEQGEVGGC